MRTRQHASDLAHAGIYLCLIGLLVFGVACGAIAGTKAVPDLFADWLEPAFDRSEPEPNRLSTAVATARQIREALAKPIPRPEPLAPITERLAYGYLKPGGIAHVAAADSRSTRLRQNVDAMAMDSQAFKASSAVIPELHKVY